MIKLLIFSVFLFTSATYANNNDAKNEVNAVALHEQVFTETIDENGKDIRVPLKIWEVLSEKKEVDNNEVYVFSEINVFLKEKNNGVVKKAAYQLNFPRGGGELDLSNYVTGKQGTFFVSFVFPEFEDAAYQKVLFISNSRKRKIDDHIFGSGCREFFDITDRFLAENKSGGIKVNTTRNRHISVLSGTFIFISKKNKQNYLTQVTFTDKEHKNLLCPEN